MRPTSPVLLSFFFSQEHLVSRAALVKLLLTRVAAQQPGLMDPQDLRQVAKTAETNTVNPAVLVLGVPQLTQLAAAIFPLEVLEEVVASAVEQAQTALLAMVSDVELGRSV